MAFDQQRHINFLPRHALAQVQDSFDEQHTLRYNSELEELLGLQQATLHQNTPSLPDPPSRPETPKGKDPLSKSRHQPDGTAELKVLHKTRGSGGSWTEILQDDRVRVTKGQGKCVRLHLISKQQPLSWTSLHIYLADPDAEDGKPGTDGVISLSNGKDGVKVCSTGYSEKNSEDLMLLKLPIITADGIVELEMKLGKISKNVQFIIQMYLTDGTVCTAKSVQFLTHNNGKDVVVKSAGKESASKKKRSDGESDSEHSDPGSMSGTESDASVQDLQSAINTLLDSDVVRWSDHESSPHPTNGYSLLVSLAKQLQRTHSSLVHTDSHGFYIPCNVELIQVFLTTYKLQLTRHESQNKQLKTSLGKLKSALENLLLQRAKGPLNDRAVVEDLQFKVRAQEQQQLHELHVKMLYLNALFRKQATLHGSRLAIVASWRQDCFDCANLIISAQKPLQFSEESGLIDSWRYCAVYLKDSADCLGLYRCIFDIAGASPTQLLSSKAAVTIFDFRGETRLPAADHIESSLTISKTLNMATPPNVPLTIDKWLVGAFIVTPQVAYWCKRFKVMVDQVPRRFYQFISQPGSPTMVGNHPKQTPPHPYHPSSDNGDASVYHHIIPNPFQSPPLLQQAPLYLYPHNSTTPSPPTQPYNGSHTTNGAMGGKSDYEVAREKQYCSDELYVPPNQNHHMWAGIGDTK